MLKCWNIKTIWLESEKKRRCNLDMLVPSHSGLYKVSFVMCQARKAAIFKALVLPRSWEAFKTQENNWFKIDFLLPCYVYQFTGIIVIKE